MNRTLEPSKNLRNSKKELFQKRSAYLLVLEDAELRTRPTFQELLDGRPGSKIMPAGENGKVRLELRLQHSSDLQNWTDDGDPIIREMTMPAGQRYFRFGIR